MITPKRRQELSLTGMALTAAGVATIAFALVRAWRRRRRR
jgi:hypothetical protein